ncbi:MAG: NADH-quinone oxidoreductase subunit A [Desulfuromonas sp.]|nr:MAG: NADH-quinone oxidoreductase subunit A [Desulfuromonas sp.]
MSKLNAVTEAAASISGAGPPPLTSLLTFGLYTLIAVGLVGFLMFVAWFLGHKTRSAVKNEPYESGVAPTGQAHLGEPVPFYLVAIFFIIFDVEMVFVVSWAVAYDLLGWAGYLQITFFIVILFLGLVWLWKSGGLDWGPQPRRVKPESEGRR